MFKKKKSLGQRIRKLFSLGIDSEGFYEELEDRFIEADISARLAMELSDEIRAAASSQKIRNVEELESFIRQQLGLMVSSINLDPVEGESSIYLFLGVNGVGKTTSMAKLAHRWKERGHNMLMAAGDTFRAAAVEQLGIHAERLGIRMVQQGQGADPSAVVFDAIDAGLSQGSSVILADSAGRLHNKTNLVKELQKIDKVIASKIGRNQYRKILVIDSTTGQNGLQQAEVFHEAVGIDGIILSKFDSRARGGIALSISRSLKIPFAYLGTGESYQDIEIFDSSALIDSIMRKIDSGEES